MKEIRGEGGSNREHKRVKGREKRVRGGREGRKGR